MVTNILMLPARMLFVGASSGRTRDDTEGLRHMSDAAENFMKIRVLGRTHNMSKCTCPVTVLYNKKVAELTHPEQLGAIKTESEGERMDEYQKEGDLMVSLAYKSFHTEKNRFDENTKDVLRATQEYKVARENAFRAFDLLRILDKGQQLLNKKHNIVLPEKEYINIASKALRLRTHINPACVKGLITPPLAPLGAIDVETVGIGGEE